MAEEEFRNTQSYIVTKTQVVSVDATSAADARKLAELMLQLNPARKNVTTNVHVEKAR